MKKLQHSVFWPPFLLLVLSVWAGIAYEEEFHRNITSVNDWILDHFSWMFSWTTFLFVLIVLGIYFSPFSKTKIGGKEAKPIMGKWNWFAICLCTTIATGILFWGCAEPLYHYNEMPLGLGIANRSDGAVDFAMSTMFLHWTITPYSIYTLAALAFALSFYNLQRDFDLSSLVVLVTGKVSENLRKLINAIGLFALVAGMAASLGTGILTISGGLNFLFEVPQTTWLNFIIAAIVVGSFTLSASTGLMKGIRILSDLNIKAFIFLALFVFLFGPTQEVLWIGIEGIQDYFMNFFQRSTGIASNIDESWSNGWTVFYWANWLAWTPVTALFLGRISRGYTVREFIRFNLFYPALFSGLWMIIFSGTTLLFDGSMNDGFLSEQLNTEGPQNVIFALLSKYPFGIIVSGLFLLIVFVSFVTAADSNTSVLSSISTRGVSIQNSEGSNGIKYLWGAIIGLVSFIMISKSGIDGVKTLSTIGGFPILFVMVFVAIGLVRMVFFRKHREKMMSPDSYREDLG